MVTAIAPAMRETPASAPMKEAHITAASPAALKAAPAPHALANHARSSTLPPTPQDFVAANRIHIKNGSLFIDPYLVLHPRELAPENEAHLREKLQLTFSLNNPSFFESKERTAIALNLGQLVPLSLGAKHAKLLEEIDSFNTQAETHTDAELTRELNDKRAPMSAIVRDVAAKPGQDPVGLESLKNSLAMYLLMREKLTQNGFMGKLTDYVVRSNNPEQVLADLAQEIGTTPIAIREAALKGGLDGVGALLGLDPRYVADVKALAEKASTHDFSYNLIEHWHLGRQLLGLDAPLENKITVGLDARITAKIPEYRDRVHHQFDVPTPIKEEELRTAHALTYVEPIQRELLYRLGYEICYSPEATADDIAFFHGINGLHRKAANDLRDVRGTYRIYFAGRGNREDAMRTLAHEIAHNLWPTEFSPAEIQKIDALAMADQHRFTLFERMIERHADAFEKLFNAYKAGTEQQKLAIIATANEEFRAYGFHAEGVFPYMTSAHEFENAVRHVYDTLSIEGDRYNRSGYTSPEERFREVISRFAELKQVRFEGRPEFLQFLSPGLNQIWENHYLPHLARLNEKLKAGTMPLVYQEPGYPPVAAHKQETPTPPLSDTVVTADGTLAHAPAQQKTATFEPETSASTNPPQAAAAPVDAKIAEHPTEPGPKEEHPAPLTTPPAPINGAPTTPPAPPVVPVTPGMPSIMEDAPTTSIAAPAMNRQTVAALSTLQSMGINPNG